MYMYMHTLTGSKTYLKRCRVCTFQFAKEQSAENNSKRMRAMGLINATKKAFGKASRTY